MFNFPKLFSLQASKILFQNLRAATKICVLSANIYRSYEKDAQVHEYSTFGICFPISQRGNETSYDTKSLCSHKGLTFLELKNRSGLLNGNLSCLIYCYLCLLLLCSCDILTEHSQPIYTDRNSSGTQNISKKINSEVPSDISVQTPKSFIKNTPPKKLSERQYLTKKV